MNNKNSGFKFRYKIPKPEWYKNFLRRLCYLLNKGLYFSLLSMIAQIKIALRIMAGVI